MEWERYKAWRDLLFSALLVAFALFGSVGAVAGWLLHLIGLPRWLCCVLGALCALALGLALLCELGASLRRKLE